MANATPIRIGQANLAGATDALFLKVFGGEVLTAFDIATVTLDKHKVRAIQHGASAQFPITGRINANYHTPGAIINGQASAVNERVISIDGLLLADAFIARIDEAMNHYEVRSEYSKQAGLSLAYAWDRNVLHTGVIAARTAANVTGGDGGSQLTSAGTLFRTSAVDLAAAIYASAQILDEKNIPESEPRFAYLRPAQYYLLAQSTALVNRDWTTGNGDYKDGKIARIGGIDLVKTNQLPITDRSADASLLTKYRGNFARTACLVMTPGAVGTVKLMDLQMEMEYQMWRQGTLVIAKYAVGTGVLRPECAVELLVA